MERKMTKTVVENQKVFIGLEVSKRNWKLNARCNHMTVATASMPGRAGILISYLRERYPGCTITVIYEAGYCGFWLRDQLESSGISCIVTPPNKVTQEKDNRVKTDRIDAARLATVLEKTDYKTCAVPSVKQREDRQVSRTLDQVQRKIVATMNQMRRFLEFHGILEAEPEGRWSISDYRKAMALVFTGSLQVAWESLVRTLRFLQEERKQLLEYLKTLTKTEEYKHTVKLYMSVPGIGWQTAIRLILEWGSLERFKTGKSFASFTGLVCSEYSTGPSIHKGSITGQGNPLVRHWLIECSWVAIRKDPVLRNTFTGIWRRCGNKKKAIVAVARKLAVRIRSISLSGQPYQLGVIQ